MSALSPRRLSMGAAAGLLVVLAASESPSVAQTAAPRPAPPAAVRSTAPAPVAVAQAATPPRPTPRRRAAPRTYARPQALTTVQSANSSARDYPSAGAYVNAALYYDFEPGRLYTVHTSPRFLTAISLRPGEKLISKAAGAAFPPAAYRAPLPAAARSRSQARLAPAAPDRRSPPHIWWRSPASGPGRCRPRPSSPPGGPGARGRRQSPDRSLAPRSRRDPSPRQSGTCDSSE